jgi:hypothetical protein
MVLVLDGVKYFLLELYQILVELPVSEFFNLAIITQSVLNTYAFKEATINKSLILRGQ